MRTQLIVALCFGLVVSLAASGQQKPDSGVRISDPIPYTRPIKIVRPIYPALARQAHIEGAVSLKCLIGPDGSVEKIEVKKGHPLLIQASTDAVSRWTFKPMVLKGKAVEMETVVNIDFQLPKEQSKPGTK
jgi:periplasmic protein TonB